MQSGDINQDGIVDSIDLSTLVSRWNTSDPDADLNNDGTVDSVDLSTLVGNWGATNSSSNPLLVDRESCIVFDPAYVSETTQALDLQQDTLTSLNNGVTYTADTDFTAMSQWPGTGNEVVPIPGTSTEWNSKIDNEITLVALARWDGSSNVGARLISQGFGTGPGEQQYEISVRSGSTYGLRSRINVNGTRLEVEDWFGTGELNPGEAFFAAVTFDGNTSRLYIARSSDNWNIELVGSANGTGSIDNGTTAPVIGNVNDGWNSPDNVWSGQIGMTGIWSRALSQQELQEIANSPIDSMSDGYTPPPAPGSAPNGFNASNTTYNSITFEWQSLQDASYYEIEVINNQTVSDISTTSRTVTGLQAETEYQARVRGVNLSGPGPWSALISVTTPQAPDPGGNLQSSVSLRDTTWYFDAEYVVGFFVNGDPWVYAPSGITITSISPAPTGSGESRRNGGMIDPIRANRTGYDGRVSSHVTNYSTAHDATLGGFPMNLSTNTTLVSAVSNDESASHRGVIYQVNPLTVLASLPDRPGYFRPSPLPGVKTPSHHIDDVDMSILPMLPPPASVGEPDLPNGAFGGSFINDHFPTGHLWRNTQPTWNEGNGWGYHRYWGNRIAYSLSCMMTQMSGDKNLQLATHVVQYGLDLGYWMKEQAERGDTSDMYGGNSYAHRKVLLMLVSELLDLPSLIDDITMPVHFMEEHRYQYANDVESGASPWTHAVEAHQYTAVICSSQSVGTYSHEIKHPSTWTPRPPNGTDEGQEIYRQCCNVSNVCPQALVVRIMDVQVPGFRSRFGAEPYLEFADRWRYELPWDPYKNYFDSVSGGTVSIGSSVGHIDGDYQEAMWNTYRSQF